MFDVIVIGAGPAGSTAAKIFLVKPVKEEQFGSVLESARKAVAYAKSRQTEKTITLVSGSVTNVLKASDICYVESLGRKLVFHLREGVTA